MRKVGIDRSVNVTLFLDASTCKQELDSLTFGVLRVCHIFEIL